MTQANAQSLMVIKTVYQMMVKQLVSARPGSLTPITDVWLLLREAPLTVLATIIAKRTVLVPQTMVHAHSMILIRNVYVLLVTEVLRLTVPTAPHARVASTRLLLVLSPAPNVPRAATLPLPMEVIVQ